MKESFLFLLLFPSVYSMELGWQNGSSSRFLPDEKVDMGVIERFSKKWGLGVSFEGLDKSLYEVFHAKPAEETRLVVYTQKKGRSLEDAPLCRHGIVVKKDGKHIGSVSLQLKGSFSVGSLEDLNVPSAQKDVVELLFVGAMVVHERAVPSLKTQHQE